jgi:hypothetical protein
MKGPFRDKKQGHGSKLDMVKAPEARTSCLIVLKYVWIETGSKVTVAQLDVSGCREVTRWELQLQMIGTRH